jgi:hypothetical protein
MPNRMVGTVRFSFQQLPGHPEKENANMNLTKQRIGGTLCIIGFALTLTARTAGASIILSVPDPLDGVFAATRTTAAFGSSTNTPARYCGWSVRQYALTRLGAALFGEHQWPLL